LKNLADELGVTTQTIIKEARRKGLRARVPTDTLDYQSAERIRDYVKWSKAL
jgi:hypothetical protein